MKLKNGHLIKYFRQQQNSQNHNIIIINNLKQRAIQAVIGLKLSKKCYDGY